MTNTIAGELPNQTTQQPRNPATSQADTQSRNLAATSASRSVRIVSLLRLYLLRVLYLLIFVGQGTIQWPMIVHHPIAWAFWHGVGSSMLFALALVAALGIRYPLQMLPLLLFELAWKATWLIAVALPMWSAHQWEPNALEAFPSIAMGIIVPLVIPWRHVVANYVKKPGDRWK
jgi:hypothetical protein